MKKIVLLTTFLVLLPATVWATTYALDHDDIANGGVAGVIEVSSSTCSGINSGGPHTVTISATSNGGQGAGVYDACIFITGVEGSSGVTITNTGGVVTIRGKDSSATSGDDANYRWGFWLYDSSDITIDGSGGGESYGFKIDNSRGSNRPFGGVGCKTAGSAIISDATLHVDNLTVNNIWVDDVQYSGVNARVNNSSTQRATVTITGPTVHDCKFTTIGDENKAGKGEGLYIGSTSWEYWESQLILKDVMIYDNIFTDNRADAIQVCAALEGTNKIYGNDITNACTFNDGSVNGAINASNGFTGSIYNNKINGSGRHGIYLRGWEGTAWIYNNIIDDVTLNGIQVYNGAAPRITYNTIVDTTGDAIELNCSWCTYPIADSQMTGTHNGSNNAAILTDSTRSNDIANKDYKKEWPTDILIGRLIENTTDGSSCYITDNDATTATCTLTGGTDNDWDSGDSYKIVPEIYDNLVVVYGTGIDDNYNASVGEKYGGSLFYASGTEAGFTNYATEDFTLTSESPALNKGYDDNGPPAADYAGTSRWSGGAAAQGEDTDIGAYELSGGGSGSTPSAETFTDITFFWRCEGTAFDASDDHSAGDDSAVAVADATIGTDAVKHGTNGCDIANAGGNSTDYYLFDTNISSITDASEVRFGAWVYINTFVDNAAMLAIIEDATHQVYLYMDTTSSTDLCMRWYNADASFSDLCDQDSLTTGTWHFIEGAAKPADNDRWLYLNGSEVASDLTTAITDFGTPDTIKVGLISNIAADFYIDHVMISNDSTRDLYQLSDDTTYASLEVDPYVPTNEEDVVVVTSPLTDPATITENPTVAITDTTTRYFGVRLNEDITASSNPDLARVSVEMGRAASDPVNLYYYAEVDDNTNTYLVFEYRPGYKKNDTTYLWEEDAGHRSDDLSLTSTASLDCNTAKFEDADGNDLCTDGSTTLSRVDIGGTGTVSVSRPYTSTDPCTLGSGGDFAAWADGSTGFIDKIQTSTKCVSGDVYQLVSNLTDDIELIDAAGVTFDLNGYTLTGSISSGNSVTIKNGIIK